MFSSLFERGKAVAVGTVTAFAVLVLSAGALDAQEGAIAGQVVDAGTLSPVVGAQVFIPGTDVGTLTGDEGRYRLTGIPAGEVQVRVRILGYRDATRSVTVRAGETTTVNFELRVSAVALDEVVVTAVGEQRARELGHHVGGIAAAEEVEASRPGDIQHLIQGRSTGVSIRRGTGTVGAGSTMRIRGAGSISLDNTPLIIVDGARISNDTRTGFSPGGQARSALADLNPEDIEDIEIVKGPAAATLYGTAGATGVIRITTKQGREGDTEYRLRAEGGLNIDNAAWRQIGYNPTDDFLQPAVMDLLFPAGETPEELQGQIIPGVKDTTYLMNLMESDQAPTFIDDPFRTGLRHNYGVAIRGGVDFVNYFVSGEWANEEGNLQSNHQQQFNLRGNLSFSPSDQIDVSVSTGFHSNQLLLPENDNNSFGVIAQGTLWPGGAFTPFNRSDPNLGGPAIETCAIAFEVARATGTPLEDANANCISPFAFGLTFEDAFLTRNSSSAQRFTGSTTLTYRPFDFWNSRFTFGYDGISDRNKFITPNVPRLLGFSSSFEGTLFRFTRQQENVTLDHSTSLAFDLTDDIGSTFTFGAAWFREFSEFTQATGRGFPAGSPAVNNSEVQEADDGFTEVRTAGFFFQEQLSYRDLLFLTGGIRFDDNSAFGEELGLQSLPSVNASFIASDLDFVPDAFQQLRIRAAWGQSALQPGSNDALALLTTRPATSVGGDIGLFPFRPGNPELKPETAEEWEVGFDAALLDGRLSTEFTWFRQTTEDALVSSPQAPSTGFVGNQWVNIGEVMNKGVEMAVDASVFDRPNLSWDVRVQATHSLNEITQLEEPIIFGLGGNSQRHAEGFPFAAHFQPSITIDEATGELVISDQAEFQGQPDPTWDGALASSLRMFDRVTVFMQAEYQTGHTNNSSSQFFACQFPFGTCAERLETDVDGNLTDLARIKRLGAATNVRSPWFESANWLKLRTASVRLDLPRSVAEIIGARGASVTVIGENLATWSDFSGPDPETSFQAGSNVQQADFLTLPPQRRFVANVSVTF